VSKKLSCLYWYLLWIHHSVIIFLMVGLTSIEESYDTVCQQPWRGGPVQQGGHVLPNRQGTKASKPLMVSSILKMGVLLHVLYQLLISE